MVAHIGASHGGRDSWYTILYRVQTTTPPPQSKEARRDERESNARQGDLAADLGCAVGKTTSSSVDEHDH